MRLPRSFCSSIDVRGGLRLTLVDTSWFKDSLTDAQSAGTWHLPDDIDPEYLEQLASESKVVDDDGRERWEPRAQGAANHFLDAEVYARAAAYLLGLWKVAGGAARAPRPSAGATAVREQPRPQPAQRAGRKPRPVMRGRSKPFGRR